MTDPKTIVELLKLAQDLEENKLHDQADFLDKLARAELEKAAEIIPVEKMIDEASSRAAQALNQYLAIKMDDLAYNWNDNVDVYYKIMDLQGDFLEDLRSGLRDEVKASIQQAIETLDSAVNAINRMTPPEPSEEG